MNYIKWLLFGRRKFRKEQQKLWNMMANGHDIGMLPGGYLIHYSVCDCATQPSNTEGDKK